MFGGCCGTVPGDSIALPKHVVVWYVLWIVLHDLCFIAFYCMHMSAGLVNSILDFLSVVIVYLTWQRFENRICLAFRRKSWGEIMILQYKVTKDDGQCPKSPVKIVGAFAKKKKKSVCPSVCQLDAERSSWYFIFWIFTKICLKSDKNNTLSEDLPNFTVTRHECFL